MTQTDPPSPAAPEPVGWQLTIDANDPHALADFWAAALRIELEDNSELIAGLLEKGWLQESETLLHHGRRYFTTLIALRGPGPRILIQRVPEGKTSKNRLHLDLNVGTEQIHSEVARLIALGATPGREVKEPSGHWFVMQDPEGNEFCVQ